MKSAQKIIAGEQRPEGKSVARVRRRAIVGVGDADHLESLDVSSVNITPPDRFSEKGFSDYVLQLCRAGKQEAAAKYFIDNLPDLLSSSINRKEKLNSIMYLPRLIQNGSGTKHGHQKLLRKAAGVKNFLGGTPVPPGGGFVELGCGAHDPLAMATYFYLNGFSPCYGVDLLTARNEVYSAISMYDILANIRAFPKKYTFDGTDPGDIMRRLRNFSLAAFEEGYFNEGFTGSKDEIIFESQDIVESSVKPDSVSLLVSYAVLEHVSDIDGVSQHIFDLLKPGGLAFHFVDLADHRAYRGDGAFGPLSFLKDQNAPANMNRLRAPEITEAHRRAGFEIVKDIRNTVDVPAEVRANLAPKFKALSDKDLGAIKQQLLVRRPG